MSNGGVAMGSRRPGSRGRGRLRDESGQALVEFAFVLIMMVILILGLIDFARLFLQYQLITDAAREGARKAVVANPAWDSAVIYDEIRDFLAVGGIDVSGAQLYEETPPCSAPSGTVNEVHIYQCNWDGSTGTVASVGIAIPFEFSILGPFIGWATGDRTITLRTWFSMRNE